VWLAVLAGLGGSILALSSLSAQALISIKKINSKENKHERCFTVLTFDYFVMTMT